MGDHIIDTNVLLVASASVPGSHFKDCDHVPAEQKKIVLDWLMEFRKDGQRKIVLDPYLKHGIWEEYNRNMTGQDIGLLVVAEKLQQSARFVAIAFDGNGHGCLPPELEGVVHDPSDRKFVAVALADKNQGGQTSIVNACDGDWYDWEETLHEAEVVVVQLIENWSRVEWKEKRKQKSKPIGHRPARSRKKAT